MNIEDIRTYCLQKEAVTEGLPFGDDTLVFKVAGKMFLLANLEGPLSVNMKASPEEVIDRIERYPEARPGYHMNKKHWISVDIDDFTDLQRIQSWIDRSYNLVVSSLPRKLQDELQNKE
ncbi:MAG: MmcQ/YjbR family DNA-binding protein [Bacteroidales bacterium]|nr:MmcQ/YjbR family DNA-binding protein [Bacteroidales bacterium]